jgi:glycosyltransferase involved in cell wall biosynthesis
MKLDFVNKHITRLRPPAIPVYVPVTPQEDYLFDIKRFIPETYTLSDTHTVTWITNSYVHRTLGGSEYMAHVINKFLIQQGFVVNVIGNWDTELYEGVHLINVRDSDRVKQVVGQSHVLLSQNFRFPELTTQIARHVDKYAVVFIHTTEPEWDLSPSIYHNDYDKLRIIYNTDWVKQSFSLPLQSIVVHPPIDMSKIASNTSRKYVTLISAVPHKGLSTFLEIAKQMSDVLFLAVGGYTNTLTQSHSNITFIPSTRNIREVYEQTDILLVPSDYESWGMVASEGIACGIPVIACPTLGLQENLSYAGLYAEQSAINGWVSIIRKLKSDNGLYTHVSAQCLKRAAELHIQNATDFDNMSTFIHDLCN